MFQARHDAHWQSQWHPERAAKKPVDHRVCAPSRDPVLYQSKQDRPPSATSTLVASFETRRMAHRPRQSPSTALPCCVRLGLVLALILAGRLADGQEAAKSTTPSRSNPVAPRPVAARNTKPAPGPQVVSRAKEQEKRGKSEFLRTPGDARSNYGELDWAELPPWRQTTFFGIRARGQFFVYVVDCSGSMVVEDRLARAKDELRRSVRGLVDPQRFLVIFYNGQAIPMPGGSPRSADLNGKSQFLEWLRLIGPDGETDPKPALSMALAVRPDAIFLLSDGEFPDGTADGIARKNPRKVPIHCIDLSGGAAGDQLEQIAHDSGGNFVSRPFAGP
jgi:hypothetical protein